MKIYRSNQILMSLLVLLFIFNTWMAKLAFNAGARGDGDEHRNLHLQRDTLVETVRLLQEQCNRPRSGSHEKAQIVCPSKLDVDRNKALVLGKQREKSDFLVIGMSTVRRQNAMYLDQTLQSLLEHTTPVDRTTTKVIILLADFIESDRAIVVERLSSKYKEHFESGFIQAITAPYTFYPPLDDLKQNFGDPLERVRWRAKQVVDYAFLFSYCHGLSKYYLQLEDDVISTPNFLFAVKEFIDVNEGKDWTSLEFSLLGFGKLYRSSDLLRLAQFVLMFYEEQPIDILFKYFNNLHAQEEVLLRSPSLFQHIGLHSSLKDKEQKAVDMFFEEDVQKYSACDNPPAALLTNMDRFSMYLPRLPYTSDPGYFWAKSPTFGQWFMIDFEEPHFLKRIVIETGSSSHPQDILQDGYLEVGGLTLPGKGPAQCKDFQTVGSFNSGVADIDDFSDIKQYQVKCVVVRILEDQAQWLLIREIAIWVRPQD
ncbi:Alpha-1,3-mannosyl-glycoprotein 4-beta-N-acetylglucosaminyltransferase C [Holothuria leucospilota]|uniref:Alpha-1,3-mannosyl-glycoprotein 4-beta-N-acetylglucosaminyltransferase C n=1 Tax=Holothuria leucospilota TaxID=206669 RepID=A0A9Q0YRS2_HOLLE|nr:Alpha-1,3-mannosyl-glycoprotein 4-beta-N-acetylglucosaminyltransferase C [Holothuria leucospilota]